MLNKIEFTSIKFNIVMRKPLVKLDKLFNGNLHVMADKYDSIEPANVDISVMGTGILVFDTRNVYETLNVSLDQESCSKHSHEKSQSVFLFGKTKNFVVSEIKGASKLIVSRLSIVESRSLNNVDPRAQIVF